MARSTWHIDGKRWETFDHFGSDYSMRDGNGYAYRVGRGRWYWRTDKGSGYASTRDVAMRHAEESLEGRGMRPWRLSCWDGREWIDEWPDECDSGRIALPIGHEDMLYLDMCGRLVEYRPNGSYRTDVYPHGVRVVWDG